MDKEILGYFSLVLSIAAYAPYMWSTFKNKTKPHVFSWFLWSLLMGIAAAGQYAGAAGPGWWATGLSAFFCFIITIQSLRHGDNNITRHDVIILVLALTALPLWYITSTPLTAILVVAGVDALAYLPTFRKSYAQPSEEMPAHYLISNVKHALSILSISHYSITTTLYPIVLFLMNTALVIMIYWRRQATKKPPETLC